jgi:hypothetical protein
VRFVSSHLGLSLVDYSQCQFIASRFIIGLLCWKKKLKLFLRWVDPAMNGSSMNRDGAWDERAKDKRNSYQQSRYISLFLAITEASCTNQHNMPTILFRSMKKIFISECVCQILCIRWSDQPTTSKRKLQNDELTKMSYEHRFNRVVDRPHALSRRQGSDRTLYL